MNKNLYKIISILALSIFVLGACAPVSSEQVVEDEQNTTVEVMEDTSADVQTGAEAELAYPAQEEQVIVQEESIYPVEEIDMEALILEKAAGNHTLDFILGEERTREEWNTILNRMIGYGANISPEEKELIIDWLVSRN